MKTIKSLLALSPIMSLVIILINVNVNLFYYTPIVIL